MQHGRKQPTAGKARRTRLGIVFADGSAQLIVEARPPYRAKGCKRAAKP